MSFVALAWWCHLGLLSLSLNRNPVLQTGHAIKVRISQHMVLRFWLFFFFFLICLLHASQLCEKMQSQCAVLNAAVKHWSTSLMITDMQKMILCDVKDSLEVYHSQLVSAKPPRNSPELWGESGFFPVSQTLWILLERTEAHLGTRCPVLLILPCFRRSNFLHQTKLHLSTPDLTSSALRSLTL